MTTFPDAQTNAFCIVVDGDNVFDIATFWHSDQIRELFPSLSPATIGVLSIPASSTRSECVACSVSLVDFYTRGSRNCRSIQSMR